MENNFDSVWNDLSILNSIPADVTSEINILNVATEDFINEVAKLENMTDYKARGAEAENYIKANNGITLIAFPVLIEYLSNYSSCPLSIWRQLYVLERSIPPRQNAERITWVERLKVFADTFKLEHAVNKQRLISLPGKLNFTRASGDHENLHMGAGNYATDFYCWDENANKNHAFVEFKHWGSNNIANAKTYYEDKRYGARYVLVFLADHTYKLIDYINNTVVDQPDLPVPELLIW